MAKVTRTSQNGGILRLNDIVKKMDNVRGKAGWFESAKYENGTPVAYVASIQEFGSPQQKIPPRPFMRKTIAEETEAWRAYLASGARAILAGNETTISVMEAVAMKAAGDIAHTISEITSPALKEATVKARMRKYADKGTVGSLTKPLVDTGYMVSSVTGVVERK